MKWFFGPLLGKAENSNSTSSNEQSERVLVLRSPFNFCRGATQEEFYPWQGLGLCAWSGMYVLRGGVSNGPKPNLW